MRMRGVLLAVGLALLAGACGAVRRDQPAGAGAATGAAVVQRVVDGDTIVVKLQQRSEKVRFIGVDTPESVKPGTPVQCFALEASARTKVLLPAGTPVRLEGDVEQRDRYGRLLAYVYRDTDDLFVNLDLVQEGFAVPLTIPPNVAHAGEFAASAATARRTGVGLWSRCPATASPA
jgi:micrococcal nuclease